MRNKKLHKLVPAAALAALAAKASAQVLYEPFDYGVPVADTTLSATSASAPSAKFNTNGTFWTTRGTAPSATGYRMAVSSMAVAGLPLPPTSTVIGSQGMAVNTGGTDYQTLPFAQYFQSAGDLWWSTSVKINNAGGSFDNTTGQFIAGISNFSLSTTSAPGVRQQTLWVRALPGLTTFQFGLGSNETSATNVAWGPAMPIATTPPFFIVAHMQINSPVAADDVLEMWINPKNNFNGPTPAGTTTPTDADAYMTKVANADLTDSLSPLSHAYSSFFIRTNVGDLGNMRFDDIRIDSTWAGVTPDNNKWFTWTGGAVGGNLSSTTSWNNAAAIPNPNGAGHVVVLGTMTTATGNLNGGAITTNGESVDTVHIRNAGNVTIDGAGLTLTSIASAAQIVAWNGTHNVTAPCKRTVS